MAWLGLAGTLLLVLGGAFLLSKERDEGGSDAVGGLPATADYHSLLVSPSDPSRLVLGTHDGLYTSIDGGRSWSASALGGRDAMNLVRTPGMTIWAAGHGVLAKSADGGETWQEVEPEGLPSLDVHGFAAKPDDASLLYAAIANEGLYLSTDGGESFSLLSRAVGPQVMALAVTPNGRILAGDMGQGLMVSGDGGKAGAGLLPRV